MNQLASQVQTIILATFKISEEEAAIEAGRLAGLAVGWSGGRSRSVGMGSPHQKGFRGQIALEVRS